jgi:RecA/RadA recombinase
MGKNLLMEALRANDKTGDLFQANGTFIAYKTGFPTLDYYLGCMVNVFDDNGKLTSQYPALGITNGSINTIIGKTHVGKTSAAIAIASNIVRPFPNGIVMHCDIEGATSYTRIAALSRYTPNEMKEGKYVLRQMKCSIEDIKLMISKIYLEKTSNPKEYMYDTGKVNEFGEPIKMFEPTCLIVDSVASLTTTVNENTKDGIKSLEEVSTQTDQMRVTGEIGRFLKESIEMCKTANIILFLINHIKEKPGMGMPQAPEMRYLKQNETMPAGKALQYYTNTMIRLISVGAEKYEKDTDGFNGFGVSAQFIKNRTNVDGTFVPLVFDKVRGYDSLRSSVSYAKSLGLVGGNKNGYYFGDDKENKFTMVNMHKDFADNRELYKIMYSYILPPLEQVLSRTDLEDNQVIDEEMDY